MKVYFSEYFEVSHEILDKYGAFDISLINDLPLFIDPFLLFNSKKKKYRELHDRIIEYLRFLRDKSLSNSLNSGLIKAWYAFPEVKQNWLGFTFSGNRGSGLGSKFAFALHENLNHIFSNFGDEKITKGSHLEKLCLIRSGVGKDMISDFTTNLIKEFLLDYTQEFSRKYIKTELRKATYVSRVRFNYETETWEGGRYDLPNAGGDYAILTPKDILTKDDTWINKTDLLDQFHLIPNAIPDDQLRSQVDNYFRSFLGKNPTAKDQKDAAFRTVQHFPQLVDYYIKYKEENGDQATNISSQRVANSEQLYIDQFRHLVQKLAEQTDFYQNSGTSYEDAKQRIEFLKDVIENKNGYRIFYLKGKPIEREEDLQILYRLTWFATLSDVNREVNNGRGPVDFKISRGAKDKALIEFKLAKNTQLEPGHWRKRVTFLCHGLPS